MPTYILGRPLSVYSNWKYIPTYILYIYIYTYNEITQWLMTGMRPLMGGTLPPRNFEKEKWDRPFLAASPDPRLAVVRGGPLLLESIWWISFGRNLRSILHNPTDCAVQQKIGLIPICENCVVQHFQMSLNTIFANICHIVCKYPITGNAELGCPTKSL
jgi:hypothetical protein